MALDVIKSLSSWTFQNKHVERNMDNAAYEAVHPDDTLVLAGPARASDMSVSPSDAGNIGLAPSTGTAADVPLLPIGMLQQIQFQQQKPTQPMMAIGSGRSFFTSGKATTSWSAGRLFVNGRNFLRVLYHNAVHLGIDVAKFDDPASVPTGGINDAGASKFFVNLDSELFYLPFGLACIFRNKAHDWVGAFYAEMCMIGSFGTGLTAGQSQVMESVSGVADRLLPIKLSTLVQNPGVNRSAVDKIVGFTDSSGTNPHQSVQLSNRNGL